MCIFCPFIADLLAYVYYFCCGTLFQRVQDHEPADEEIYFVGFVYI